MIVEGQVHGGIAQGVGQALYEGTVYDKDGQLVTGSYMDYAMPRADYLRYLLVAKWPGSSRPFCFWGRVCMWRDPATCHCRA